MADDTKLPAGKAALGQGDMIGYSEREPEQAQRGAGSLPLRETEHQA